MKQLPRLIIKLPGFIQKHADAQYLDVSLGRIVPLAILLVFGALAGLVFTVGIDHPYDKIIHIGFFALLTLSIQTLFRWRLRYSAAIAFMMGLGGELIQGLLPHHYMSMADAFANAIGVCLIAALIALIRSETKQALEDVEDEVDLGEMGLKPVPTRYLSGASSDSSFSSDK